MTDQELLERFREGDVSAFEALLERYEGPLLRYAARHCRRGGWDAAQDIVQEVFLRLVREVRGARDGDGPVDHVSAWLYRVARNLAIDAARKEERMDRREQRAAVSEVQQPEPCGLETQEVSMVVETKLRGLPPRQRDVLILKIQERKSYREISEITGLSVSNVGYLIHQGLRALAQELRALGVV